MSSLRCSAPTPAPPSTSTRPCAPPEAVVVSIDDQPWRRFAEDGSGERARWPFDAPFPLILNLAVGGDRGGQEGVDEAAFPQAMQVDRVRVGGSEGTSCGLGPSVRDGSCVAH